MVSYSENVYSKNTPIPTHMNFNQDLRTRFRNFKKSISGDDYGDERLCVVENFEFHQLGSHCDLNLSQRRPGSISDLCDRLEEFLSEIYGQCRTHGENLIRRLGERCNRIEEIKAGIAKINAEFLMS